MQNPRNQSVLEALVLHASDTVNVVALNARGGLILVEQFRFGINRNLIELPAGLIDDGESPLQAAKRELKEEVGGIANEWVELGVSYLNPAYVDNRCFHFLATNVRMVKTIKLDTTEYLKCHIIQNEQIKSFLSNNGIQDAIGIAALSMAFPNGW